MVVMEQPINFTASTAAWVVDYKCIGKYTDTGTKAGDFVFGNTVGSGTIIRCFYTFCASNNTPEPIIVNGKVFYNKIKANLYYSAFLTRQSWKWHTYTLKDYTPVFSACNYKPRTFLSVNQRYENKRKKMRG